VTLAPDGAVALDLFHTLQVPIQTPVSPDERWVATAVFSLTTVPRAATGTADHVALIDTSTNEVVAFVPAPAGAHGVNWGPKLGGGYYAYVTAQHANVLTVIDPDPNGDGDGHDAAVVGTTLLANGSPGAGVTDGVGGQGVKPLPLAHDGWIQETLALSGTGALSAEVEGWLALLTDEQKNPVGEHGHELTLTLDALSAGSIADLAVVGAAPGAAVFYAASLVGVGAGPCFPVLGGLCVDILPPFILLGSAAAGADGVAVLSVPVPPGTTSIDVHLQALVPAGAASAKSQAVTATIQ